MQAALITPKRLWGFIFAVWGVFLSGVLAGMVGSPGAIQALRLKSLLEAKQDQISQIEGEVHALEAEAGRLEKSRVAQEREIRRTLGYAAPDEIIFDFASNDKRAESAAPPRTVTVP